MPRIFDNIEQHLLPALRDALDGAHRADFCVGYFNLRGWHHISPLIDEWSGEEGACCRLLIGMHRSPDEDLRRQLRLGSSGNDLIDQQAVLRLKKQAAQEFRDQLTIGAPTDLDEASLRKLSAQLKCRKLIAKLFLRHPLHAKLYLAHRPGPITPTVGYLGSSNLTFAGLKGQGELNVDVLDHDACAKLSRWFEDRWSDARCLDISEELAQIIDESWAREELLSPYHLYLKIAYHLSQEARAGLSEFRIPRVFGDKLFDFQVAAVKIAAHHLNKRGGVLIGDVVGLGKTLMASALARIMQDDQGTDTLIICPKNLESMWQAYQQNYGLIGRILPITQVLQTLPDLRRYRIVLIDESHNLRNREGKQYRAIQEYIDANESRCILLSATPYNKSYLDLGAQLRLFVDSSEDLGIRPEQAIKAIGETEFIRRHQCGLRTLAAFEKSEHADDWRDLMRRYLVRRTRTFIQDNYAKREQNGRPYLTLTDGTKSHFPTRLPKTLPFTIDDHDPSDPYARLYASRVVDAIDGLRLARTGLGNYVTAHAAEEATPVQKTTLDGLSRAGVRLMGFTRTNLFKRLESGGPAFLQSIERHALRNFVVFHALEHGLDVPIGGQDARLLDSAGGDEDQEAFLPLLDDEDVSGPPLARDGETETTLPSSVTSEQAYRERAAKVYTTYREVQRRRFKWLPAASFRDALAADLLADARSLLAVLDHCGVWDPARDPKLATLRHLLTSKHPDEKVLVFTQYADTVDYLSTQLQNQEIPRLMGVTGAAADPTRLARRFSPISNDAKIDPADELRVLIATDVLSEGQNLQDCAVVVNYDLPWAIIRLIQRAGRVDRIGQQAEVIQCYSFLPAEGVERIINLRGRVRTRLRENAEVVGADETFFEDDGDDAAIVDLYHEKAGILDGEADTEVDLASFAYQIWKNASDADPSIKKVVESLPDVVYATRSHQRTPAAPDGVLIYLRTADDNDALIWVDPRGQIVTESQLAILRAAGCDPATPALQRRLDHHHLVKRGVDQILQDEVGVGGQLGRPSGARFRTYTRLKEHLAQHKGQFFATPELERAIEEIYRSPLQQFAIDTLNRQLKSGVPNQQLAELVVNLRQDGRLTTPDDAPAADRQARIICSMGLSS